MRGGIAFVLLCAVAIATFPTHASAEGENSLPEGKIYAFEGHKCWQRPRFVVGVKYDMGDCGAMPLGGLGTGTVSLNSFGAFERNGLMNNPRPQGGTEGCFFVLRCESPERKITRILQGTGAYGLEPVQGLKFLGHFPMLDIGYEDDALPAEISLRAMTPLVYRDSKNSGLPAILFTFRVKSVLDEPGRVSLAFSWAKPSPDTMDGMRIQSRGNVGAIASWREELLPPGKAMTVCVIQSLAASVEKLKAELRKPQEITAAPPEDATAEMNGQGGDSGILLSDGEIEFALDEDGCFNWENWRKETFTWENTPMVGQHYFAIHYSDEENRVAGVAYRPGAPNERRNLVVETPSQKLSPHSAVTKLTTSDGDIAVEIHTLLSSPSVARIFQITNRSKTDLRNVQLRYFVNYDVGGPGQESNDVAGYLNEPLAAVISDGVSGVVCGLGGKPQPDGIRVSSWSEARDRLFAGEVSIPQALKAPAKPRRTPRTTVSENDTLLMLSHESPSGDFLGGYTLAVLKDAGIEVEALKNWGVGKEACEAKNPWRAFAEEGRWVSAKQEGDNPEQAKQAMALSARVSLKPGEHRDVRFLLTWFFPDQRDSDGQFIGHMYSNWFAGSQDVAEYVAARWSALHEETAVWQEAIYGSTLPSWLKDGLVNSLYSLARNTLWIKDGRFAHSESFMGCPITETIVCRFYGSIPTAMLFPELERNTMLQFARHQRADGAVPFAFGMPEAFDKPYYETQKSLDSSEFALMAYRDYRWWNDETFLREIYPHVKKAIRYAMTLDTDGDGVINEVSMQYYDIWQFKGTSAYVGTIWLAALGAAHEMAKATGDTSFAEECSEAFTKASHSLDEKLWNGRYYRLYNDPATAEISETCLGNQLVGQWFAYSAGLGEILPKPNVFSSLKAVAELNASLSPFGLINGVQPDGTPDTTGQYHSASITIGETYCYAATCLYAGGPDTGMDMARRLYENIALRLRTPWNTTWNMDPQTGRLGWGAEYYSNLCLWDLYGALTGKRELTSANCGIRVQPFPPNRQ